MNEKYPFLNTISNPDDLKKLSMADLSDLAEELRRKIINVVSQNGGHLASNLGVIELTIALHRVFQSPVDKIIWDVGHQCYVHKLLTGRKEQFASLRKLNGISGFPKRSESVHDITDTGHSSTSLSSGLGILLGQKILKIEGNVVAVIGDGALTGGMALEALNHAGHIGKRLIIVLNDNEMSISRNVGALSSHLSRLTATHTYQKFQRKFDNALKKVPLIGERAYNFFYRLKKGIKAILFRQNLFSDLGYEYIGPIDGHNIPVLIDVFSKVKDINKPVVVHVITRKGKGYIHAEGNPSLYHGVGSFSVIDGKLEILNNLTFTDAFSEAIIKLAEKDHRITAITAAMTTGTGLSFFKELYPERFFDVGITEQHATTFAAGLALAGMRPVVAIYSTFIQRAVDQVIHDVALPRLPVVICMDRSGLVGGDGETHQGVFDIALFRNIPGLTLLSPATGNELDLMLRYGLEQNSPVLIRYPKSHCLRTYNRLDEPLAAGRGVLINNSGNILIITTGGIFSQVIAAGDQLFKEDIAVDIYNLRFLKPLDEKYLLSIITRYKYLLVVEDGVISGGIGEKIRSVLNAHNFMIPCECLGVPDEFVAQGTSAELLALSNLDSKSIMEAVINMTANSEEINRFKLG